jgi:hypothetical protein
MSKERDLLGRWLDDTIFEPEELDSLMEETRELLAQPEQEPVAWMYEWYENDLESTQVTGGSEKPFEGEIMQPFNIRPLYASPPKQEPLSESRIAAIWGDSDYDVAVVRRIEKAHGITGVNDE